MGNDLFFGQSVKAVGTIAISGLLYLCTNITGLVDELSEPLARANELDTELRVFS